jgi:hypothetical protein
MYTFKEQTMQAFIYQTPTPASQATRPQYNDIAQYTRNVLQQQAAVTKTATLKPFRQGRPYRAITSACSHLQRIVVMLFIVVLAAAMPAADLQAQSLSGIPGSFVDIGFGARPVALGNAYTALANDEHAAYWNPAGLASVKGYLTSFSHANQLRMVDYSYVTLAAPLPGATHGAGATIIASGDDLMRELSVHLAYAYKYGPLSAGIGLKYRNASFGKNMFNDSDYIIFEPDEINLGRLNQVTGDASGFGVDLGLLYQVNERARVSLVYRDMAASLNWNSATTNPDAPARGSYSEGLPSELIIGSAVSLRDNIMVTADFRPSLYSDTDNVLHMGAEAVFADIVALRGGTRQRANDREDALYAAGVGLISPEFNGIRVRLDYTYVFDPLENSQRISFAIQF